VTLRERETGEKPCYEEFISLTLLLFILEAGMVIEIEIGKTQREAIEIGIRIENQFRN
jgi:Xaa-Pro aminopeptidase